MGLKGFKKKVRSFGQKRSESTLSNSILDKNEQQNEQRSSSNNQNDGIGNGNNNDSQNSNNKMINFFKQDNYIKKSIQSKKEFNHDGSVNFRVLAFAGGISVIATSFLSILLCIARFDIPKVLIYAYTLVFGILICIMEGQFLRMDSIDAWRATAIDYVPALKYLWGRGFFYTISGALQMSHYAAMNIISGVYLIAVGILFIIIGLKTRRRMKKLKKALKDERVLKRHFQTYDKDKDGMLSIDEFGALAANLTGEDMDEDELEGAFGSIDTSSDGVLSLEEFVTWFQGFKVEEDKEYEGGCGTAGFVLV